MNKITAFFTAIWHKFKPVEEQAIQDFENKVEQAGPKLLELGVDAVKCAAASTSGPAARDAAVAQLVSDAKAEGIDLEGWAKNELNTVIELCYLAAKPTIAMATAVTSEPEHETAAATS